MPVQSVGPFSVDGPQPQIDLVKRALGHLDPDVDMNFFIRGPFEVVFHPVGNVPGTNTPAFGFFHGGQRRLEIRHGMANARDLKPAEVEYTFLHESFGHGGEHDGVLNFNKRRDILTEMHAPLVGDAVMRTWRRGATPAGHAVRYWERPYEAYCDMLVAAISDQPAMFENKYVWDIDAKRLKQIVLRNDAPDPRDHPHPDDPPDPPTPDDPDPQQPDPLPPIDSKGIETCAELRAQVVELNIRVAELEVMLNTARRDVTRT
jgi:hypothetical protein